MTTLLTGFNVSVNAPIDDRLIKTKEEMKNTDDSIMPDVYMCICTDDGSAYVYSKTNDLNPETGKYRPISGSVPTMYYYQPESGESAAETSAKIRELALTLNPGDIIICIDDIFYKSYPDGEWDATTDRPLFKCTSRYDIHNNNGRNAITKLVLAEDLEVLGDTIADAYFKKHSQEQGYAAAAPDGKGYLIPSSKEILLEDIKAGYDSLDEIIDASVPAASKQTGLKTWSLKMDTQNL